jgi:AbiJ N-terminal domain 4
MAVVDLFSKRKKREQGDASDVYTYSQIPEQLRVQIIHIWWDAIGKPGELHDHGNIVKSAYEHIVKTLRREYGVFTLTKELHSRRQDENPLAELTKFFLEETDTLKLIDVIELSFRLIDSVVRNNGYLSRYGDAGQFSDAAIKELNVRFREHGVGYYYANRIIMRVDSELIHGDAVKPALTILRQKGFESAEQEFVSAHKHYRAGQNSQALIDCCKSFESVMKIICTKRDWKFEKTKPASHLIDVCLANNLIPAYWQSHFTGLRQMLEAAIPTPRNKIAGHGAGTSPAVEPSVELTGYVLHMTAATILFLTEAEKNIH